DLESNFQKYSIPMPGVGDIVMASAFSPDSRRLAVGVDNKIITYDIPKRTHVYQINAHSGWISALAFSPDGQFLFSGSWDHTIRSWDAQTGDARQPFVAHTNTVQGLSFLSGKLLSASQDGTFRVWIPETGRLLATIFSFGDVSKWMLATPEGLFDG